ncbi:MAG: hypothetical protein IPL62_20130 [Caulobacteraceae bacterium]|nr:hypothetical protein [Caulobacteraceae bacterium]
MQGRELFANNVAQTGGLGMNSRASNRAQALDAFVFPERPASAPQGLTQASKKYKRHATIAMLSLLAFVLAYVARDCVVRVDRLQDLREPRVL